jgi:hypothetical protein
VSEPIVSIIEVVKEYQLGATVVPALRGVSLDVPGRFMSSRSAVGRNVFLGCVDARREARSG